MDIDMLQAQIENLKDEVRELRRELDEIKKQLTPAEPPIPWQLAPDWAQWAAMDADGEWWWYENEPEISHILWRHTNGLLYCFNFPPCTNWRESKRQRP